MVNFGFVSVLFFTPDASFLHSCDPKSQLVWAGNPHSPLWPKPPQGAHLQPPSSYPTWWESSYRLWGCRKLVLGAGMGGGGAAVMSRETADNRQTDGTGARGRCASNAHPRPSSRARQSGTHNSIPGERWSRVRGPQHRNLRVKETSELACQFPPGKEKEVHLPRDTKGIRRTGQDPGFLSF